VLQLAKGTAERRPLGHSHRAMPRRESQVMSLQAKVEGVYILAQ